MEIEESVDEMASYFNRETVPKVLITTSDRPSQVRYLYMLSSNKFCSLLLSYFEILCVRKWPIRGLRPISISVKELADTDADVYSAGLVLWARERSIHADESDVVYNAVGAWT